MRHILATCLLLISLSLAAQVAHEGRFELEYETEIKDFVIIPNHEYGALIVTPRFRNSSQDYPVQLDFVDADLKGVWREEISVEKRFNLMGYYAWGQISYLLFQNRTNDTYTKIVKVDPLNNEVVQMEPKQIVDLDITEFEVIQNTAILGGYYEERPAVFAYDMESNKVRTLSNVYQRNSELVEIKVNADSVTFNVIASVQTENKDRTLMVNTYDYGGNLVRDYVLDIPQNYQLISGVSSSIWDKEQIVAGMYTVNSGTYPTGFFINHVDRTGIQNMKFYSFGQFDNFLNHAGKRKDKYKQKSLNALKSEKAWRYKTAGVFKELIELDGKILFTGEFYRPWSSSNLNYYRAQDQMNRYNQFNYAGGLGNPAIRPNSQSMTRAGVQNEINFTHSFAFELDYQGNIQWDGSMNIEETIEDGLASLGDFVHHDGNAYYAYYHDELLVAAHLNAENDSSQHVGAITLLNEEDELRYERDDFRGLIRWHENKFLIHGIHHIRDEDLRKVFFVNAISMNEVTSQITDSKQ